MELDHISHNLAHDLTFNKLRHAKKKKKLTQETGMHACIRGSKFFKYNSHHGHTPSSVQKKTLQAITSNTQLNKQRHVYKKNIC